MRILDLQRRADGTLLCRLEDTDREIVFDVLPFVDGPLRGVNLGGLSKEDRFRIYEAVERRDLFRQFFRFLKGEHVPLPHALDSMPASALNPSSAPVAPAARTAAP